MCQKNHSLLSSGLILANKNIATHIIRPNMPLLSTPNHTQHQHMQTQDQDMGIIEDPEALYPPTYHCPIYYVQSPSTISRANSTDYYVIPRNNNNNNNNNNTELEDSALLYHERNTNNNHHHDDHQEQEAASRFSTLSRYSLSSRDSNHSFSLHDQKKVLALHTHTHSDVQSHTNATETTIDEPEKRLIVVDGNNHNIIGNEEEEGRNNYIRNCVYYHHERSSAYNKMAGYYDWWTYLSFSRSSSSAWILLQIGWRLLVSLAVALLVFYIATKPPIPKISAEVTRIPEFVLGEGVDSTGVTTKILTCNCSINLLIQNKSKLFRLHIHPIQLELAFGHLPLAISKGPDDELYAGSDGFTSFPLYVGTRNKPMYGAGRSMQDLVDSGDGLPLTIRASLTSSFHVVRGLINPKFHHHLQCLFVLGKSYDKKHRTQLLNNSSCIVM